MHTSWSSFWAPTKVAFPDARCRRRQTTRKKNDDAGDDDGEGPRLPLSFHPLPLWSMPCSSHVTSQNLAPIWLPHWPAWRATISRMVGCREGKRKKKKGELQQSRLEGGKE